MIKSFPDTNLRALFRSTSPDDPLVGSKDHIFYSSARAAIYHCARSLAASSGSEILLPSYHCGVEVEAVIRAGCKPRFYRVKKDFSIDLEHIKSLLTPKSRAILATHYYGFPQSLLALQTLCLEHHIVLIEDCAHALYSRDERGNWLGFQGDFGVFSFSKTIALPSGGALQINRKLESSPPRGKPNLDLRVVKTLIKSACEYEIITATSLAPIARLFLSSYATLRRTQDSHEDTSIFADSSILADCPLLGYEKKISPLISAFYGRDHISQVLSRRRRNFQTLAALFAAANPTFSVFADLPAGTAPLVYPVRVNDRDLIVDRMKDHGVEVYVFGRTPHPALDLTRFPEAQSLSTTILGLPIHQQLSLEEVEQVFSVFVQSTVSKPLQAATH